MARFSFGKRNHEEEEIPPEPIDEQAEVEMATESGEGGGRSRRLILILGIGVVVAGVAYLANQLFFAPPPSAPPMPSRILAKAPGAQAPIPPPTKAPAAPAPAAQAPPPAPSAPPAEPPAPPPAKAPAALAPAKEAKTPAPAAVSATPPAKAPAAPAPAAQAATGLPASKAESAAPAKAAAKPAESSGAAKTSAKPARAVPTKGFSIQVGAMAVEENAQALKRKLDDMGFPAFVRTGSGYTNKHLVMVGDPLARDAAEALARRLNVDGFPSQLVKVDGKYVPQVGAFVNFDDALDLARELQTKSYRPKITSNKPATSVLFQVRHGEFDTRAAALKRGEELKAKGFSAWVVPN